jgi:AMP nucleosidase
MRTWGLWVFAGPPPLPIRLVLPRRAPFAGSMQHKSEIVRNWLPRYTGTRPEEFGQYILLANFQNYVDRFAEWHGAEVRGIGGAMTTATHGDITIVNFGMGSANAATIMDLLGAITPKAVLFLGKCGGLKKETRLGALVLPIAAIRGEGTSNDYFPPEIPALPAFALQKAVSRSIRESAHDYYTGTVYSTNRRVWEHDADFKQYLERNRIMAIDMETATIFTVGFHNHISTGALLLVSDQPMTPEGVKTANSDRIVTENFLEQHLRIGIEALRQLIEKGETVRHLIF